MAQQLPLYQIPMPQGQQQSYNLPPLQMPQPQMQSQMPDFVNNPNIDINTKRQMLNQINQPQVVADVSPQSMAVAGANRNGINWLGALGTLGSYLSAAGSGMAGQKNISAGLANAANNTRNLQQNIRQYDTMKPYYESMGYDVTRLDPRRGGAGVASTPESMIQLQSLVDQRNMNNLYRQQMIEALKEKQQGTQGGKVLTVGQLMMLSPEFKARMQGQYDFSSGQNADLLNQQIPTSLLQGYMPAKKVDMRYSGGLKSSKTSSSTIKHVGGSGGGKKSGGSKKLIF